MHTPGHTGIWLRLAVTGIAVGWALTLLQAAGSHAGAWLLMEAEWPHAHIKVVERTTALALLGLAGLIWLPRLTPLALLISALVLANAVFGVIVGGFAFSELSPAAHALRILTPVALVSAWWHGHGGGAAARHLTDALLRIGLATVFVAHGYEAWAQHPEFADYLLATAGFVTLDLSDGTIAAALRAIAVADVVVAIAVLVRPAPPILIWMALWGLVTALARPVAYGWEWYPEVMVRAPHFLAPIALQMLRHGAKNTPGQS